MSYVARLSRGDRYLLSSAAIIGLGCIGLWLFPVEAHDHEDLQLFNREADHVRESLLIAPTSLLSTSAMASDLFCREVTYELQLQDKWSTWLTGVQKRLSPEYDAVRANDEGAAFTKTLSGDALTVELKRTNDSGHVDAVFRACAD